MSKKKIKDLTLKEAKEICRQNLCKKCPLNTEIVDCYLIYLENKEYWEKHLEREVKVDE